MERYSMLRKGRLRRLKPLGKLLPGYLDKIGLSERLTQQKAVIFWNKAVGQDIRKQTVANRIENGILYVSVTSPIWMNELVYLKSGIIKKLNELIGREAVKDIKFYLK
jgi:predicted nucleic acid-binding Zn ribbon protein